MYMQHLSGVLYGRLFDAGVPLKKERDLYRAALAGRGSNGMLNHGGGARPRSLRSGPGTKSGPEVEGTK